MSVHWFGPMGGESQEALQFAYEEAEIHLDEFAATQDPVFQRTWEKLKLLAEVYAQCDHSEEGEDSLLALSRGWEELQLGFAGHGGPMVTGAVMELWCCLPNKKARRRFKRALRSAFFQAEVATPVEAPRLYLHDLRTSRIRDPNKKFDIEVPIPLFGVKLREWARFHDVDVEGIEAAYASIEYEDRFARY